MRKITNHKELVEAIKFNITDGIDALEILLQEVDLEDPRFDYWSGGKDSYKMLLDEILEAEKNLK